MNVKQNGAASPMLNPQTIVVKTAATARITNTASKKVGLLVILKQRIFNLLRFVWEDIIKDVSKFNSHVYEYKRQDKSNYADETYSTQCDYR